MKPVIDRQTVDLSAFPNLVVIYLGMRLRTLAGIKTLLGFGPRIEKAGAAGHLWKPFDEQAVLDAIGRAVGVDGHQKSP